MRKRIVDLRLGDALGSEDRMTFILLADAELCQYAGGMATVKVYGADAEGVARQREYLYPAALVNVREKPA